MSDDCNRSCNSCEEDCADRKEAKTVFREKPHELSNIKKVIGIVSGKGGVGKSSVTSMLAVRMQKLGYHVAIFDADVTGPSIPKAFGLQGNVMGDDSGWYPRKSKTGI